MAAPQPRYPEKPVGAMLLQLAVLAAALLAFRSASRLFLENAPEALYRRPVIAAGVMEYPALLAAALTCLLPMAAWRSLAWSRLEGGTGLRWIVGSSCLVLTWSLATYDPNHYYGQAHVLDRLLLVGLAAGSFASAAFVPACSFQTLLILSQFAHPMGMAMFPTVELRLPLAVLLCGTGFVALRLLLARTPWAPDANLALVLCLCVIGSSYVFPGLEKLRLSPHLTEWVLQNDLSWLLVEASRRGWLLGLDDGSFDALRRALSTLSPWLLAASLALELSGLLLLLRARVTVAILLAFAAFHVFSALVSGFFFWKWLGVDLAAAAGVWRMGEPDRRVVFSRRTFVLSLLFIGLAFFYLQPNRLGWFERPYTYHFRFELEDDGGGLLSTDPSAFGPYAITFAYDRFSFLMDRKALRGQKAFEGIDALRRGGPEGVESVRERFGRRVNSPEARERLDRFLRGWFAEKNRSPEGRSWLRWLQPPPFQVRWVNRDPDPYRGQTVRRVRVRYVEEYYRGKEVIPLLDAVIHQVEIPDRGPSSAPRR